MKQYKEEYKEYLDHMVEQHKLVSAYSRFEDYNKDNGDMSEKDFDRYMSAMVLSKRQFRITKHKQEDIRKTVIKKAKSILSS